LVAACRAAPLRLCVGFFTRIARWSTEALRSRIAPATLFLCLLPPFAANQHKSLSMNNLRLIANFRNQA
jgi:hypothetical protein